MSDWVVGVCIVGFCVCLSVPLVRFLWFMVNRDPDDPLAKEWEKERAALSRGEVFDDARLARLAAQEARVAHEFRRECLAATRLVWWSALAGVFAVGLMAVNVLRGH